MFSKITSYVNEYKNRRSDNLIVINSLIGEQTEISGDIKIDGNLKLDGKLHGNIEATGDVVISESGKVMGNISCQSIIVSGLVEGDIETRDQFTITASATVKGDVVTHGFTVDVGSKFIGNCKILEEEDAPSLEPAEGTQTI